MPLFMIVSGYLFANSIQKYETKRVIKSRIQQLVIPLIGWAFIKLCLSTMKELIIRRSISLKWVFENAVAQFIYGPWFLWAILLNSIIILIVNKKFRDSIFIYLFVFLISFFTPDWNRLHLYKFMYPFFTIAFYYNYNNYSEKYDRIIKNRFSCFL